MPSKQEEPEKMIDFMLNKLDAEDEAIAAMIQPLPPTVRPSAEFLTSMRAQLMNVVGAEAAERHAA